MCDSITHEKLKCNFLLLCSGVILVSKKWHLIQPKSFKNVWSMFDVICSHLLNQMVYFLKYCKYVWSFGTSYLCID